MEPLCGLEHRAWPLVYHCTSQSGRGAEHKIGAAGVLNEWSHFCRSFQATFQCITLLVVLFISTLFSLDTWFFFFFFFKFLAILCSMWDLIPQPGIEPMPPAVQAWRLNYCTAREVPALLFLNQRPLKFSLLRVCHDINYPGIFCLF